MLTTACKSLSEKLGVGEVQERHPGWKTTIGRPGNRELLSLRPGSVGPGPASSRARVLLSLKSHRVEARTRVSQTLSLERHLRSWQGPALVGEGAWPYIQLDLTLLNI